MGSVNVVRTAIAGGEDDFFSWAAAVAELERTPPIPVPPATPYIGDLLLRETTELVPANFKIESTLPLHFSPLMEIPSRN